MPTLTESAHLLAMLIGGGLAIGADRTTIRVIKKNILDRYSYLEELHAVHRPVVISFALLFITGIALAAADIDTFVASPAFWVKLGLVALLLINGGVLTWTESRLRKLSHAVVTPSDGASWYPVDRARRRWTRLRVTSALSIILWALTLIAGAVLVDVA
ncbi:MAG TPA: hypothetical protein VE967_09725 [Gemmatimonadaceae bacterium]|nr:hypothetical protein [Gemmatimonadaceae bacterium]